MSTPRPPSNEKQRSGPVGGDALAGVDAEVGVDAGVGVDGGAGAHAPGGARSPRTEALRRQLGLVVLAWVFGSLWMWTISGAAMTQFARELGLPDAGFGVLAALPFLGTLFQLPASWVQERFGRRKPWFILTLGSSRLLWVAVALLPWVVPAGWGESARWGLMLGLVGLSWVLGHLGGPAFMSWFSDLVPRRVRGRYVGLRNLVTLPLSLLATLGGGAWLAQTEAAEAAAATAGVAGEGGRLLVVTSLLIGLAGLLGLLDILMFFWVRDPRPTRGDVDSRWGQMLRTPLKDRNFRRYLIYNFTLMLALGFLGQYVWLFVLDQAKVSFLQANLMLIAVPLVLRSLAYPFWGRVVDRIGKKPVILISGGLFVLGPMGWLFVTPELVWPGYALTMLSPLVFPGIEIANFNFMLDLAETRKGQRGGSAYVAINSIVVGLGGMASGLLGSAVAAGIPQFHWEGTVDWPWLAWVGMEVGAGGAVVVVTYHGVLFMLSMALRVAALVWATTLVEPRAAGTREALQYVSSSLYSNLRQGLLMPTRVVGNAARWSYRLNRRVRRPG